MGAVSFASENFAEQLGTASRTASGDLSKEAIVYAYLAMGDAVANALIKTKLVVAVGSFRSEEQRKRFRYIADLSGASVTTLRIVCPVETAAKRIRARLALGERGPTEKAILEIDAELNRAMAKTPARRRYVLVQRGSGELVFGTRAEAAFRLGLL